MGSSSAKQDFGLWGLNSDLSRACKRRHEKLQDALQKRHEYYAGLKTVKSFHSYLAKVELVEGGLVRKRYHTILNKSSKWLLWHEIALLEQLHSCPYTPKLVHVDHDRQTFYQTFCGEPVKNSPEIQEKIAQMLAEIRDQYHVVHSSNHFKPRFKSGDSEGILNNVTTKDDKLFIIDLGSTHWSYKKPKNLSIKKKKNLHRKPYPTDPSYQ
jgi:hypothetical protein